VELWRQANLRAQAQLMKILNGGSGPLSTASGTVSIDLTPIVGNLSSTPTERTDGAVTLPPDTGNIVLLKSDQHPHRRPLNPDFGRAVCSAQPSRCPGQDSNLCSPKGRGF
jgi:hypothetical protein